MKRLVDAMTIFTRLHGRIIITLFIGISVGVLISPISLWIRYEDRTLCEVDPRLLPAVPTRYINLGGGGLNESDQVPMQPPQLPDNETILSQKELERVVPPPRSTKVRRRELEQELAPRKLLFVGVVTAKKYLSTRALGIARTWGKDVEDFYFFSSQSDDKDLRLPIITLPGINDTQYPPQRKVYTMLKYMYDHYIDKFDFFMRSDDDVYLKVDQMMELLMNANPAQDLYMGCPGFGRPDDRYGVCVCVVCVCMREVCVHICVCASACVCVHA